MDVIGKLTSANPARAQGPRGCFSNWYNAVILRDCSLSTVPGGVSVNEMKDLGSNGRVSFVVGLLS